MARPTLTYNASSGSDTLASGSNAPTTAVTSVTSSITIATAASTTQTFSAAVDLTGVLDDDTDAIWINTTAGTRHLFQIVTFTGGVAACTAIVTTETAGTTQSGLSWAIGGKRLTIQADTSKKDFTDFSAGWTATMEAGTYDTGAAITIPAGDHTNGPITIQSTAGAIFRATANTGVFTFATRNRFIGLEFSTNSGTANATAGFHSGTGSGTYIRGCKFGSTLGFGIRDCNAQVEVVDCEFACNASSGNNGISITSRADYVVRGCYFHDCVSDAILLATSSSFTFFEITDCVFDTTASGKDGVKITAWDATSVFSISNCTFYGCADGIDSAAPGVGSTLCIKNCIFVNCTAYGINVTSVGDMYVSADYNAFYNNTSGARNNLTAGANDVTLTGDPFTSAAGGDFSLNTTAGAGAACTQTGFPQTVKGSATDANFNIGVAQNALSAGGGLIRHPGMDGGLNG